MTRWLRAFVYLFLSTRPDYLPLGVYGNLLIPFDDYSPAGAGIFDATGRFTVGAYFPLVPSLVRQTLYLQGFAQSEVFGAFSLTDVAGAHIEF